jgi:hypothetical protein
MPLKENHRIKLPPRSTCCEIIGQFKQRLAKKEHLMVKIGILGLGTVGTGTAQIPAKSN